MALPVQSVLALRIKELVDNNKETEADAAVLKFSKEMAKLILEVCKEADVYLPPNSIQTIVQTVPATGVGTGINSVIAAFGKLQ